MGWTTGVQFLVWAWKGFFFSLPPQPDWLWSPPSLLSNKYQQPIPWGGGKAARVWSYACIHPHLHGVVLN